MPRVFPRGKNFAGRYNYRHRWHDHRIGWTKKAKICGQFAWKAAAIQPNWSASGRSSVVTQNRFFLGRVSKYRHNHQVLWKLESSIDDPACLFLADDSPAPISHRWKRPWIEGRSRRRKEEEEGQIKKRRGGGETVDPPRRGPLNLQSIFSCTDPISKPVRAI